MNHHSSKARAADKDAGLLPSADRVRHQNGTAHPPPNWNGLLPTPSPEWERSGRCRDDISPDRWVDMPLLRVKGRDNPAYEQRLNDLRRTCHDCPVYQDCLATSLTCQVNGIWAGTDEYERADLREALALTTPMALTVSPLDPDVEQPRGAVSQQTYFEMRRAARRGLSNTDIARQFTVSLMTVSRALADTEDPDPSQT